MKYRFKTKEEFQEDGMWNNDPQLLDEGYPDYWNNGGNMNHYLGEDIPEEYNEFIEKGKNFEINNWSFRPEDIVEAETLEQKIEKIKLINSLITNKMKEEQVKKPAKLEVVEAKESSIKNDFVFMDKTLSILEVGMMTRKNVVLFGAGGHGM